GRVAAVSSATGTVFWQKATVADDGRTSLETFSSGNGATQDVSSTHDFDPLTGRLMHIATGSGSIITDQDGGRTFQNPLQSLGYAYFPDGKLQGRNDFVLGSTEVFSYDNVDRVTSWTLASGGSEVDYHYDETGNLFQRLQTDPTGIATETYQYGEQ